MRPLPWKAPWLRPIDRPLDPLGGKTFGGVQASAA
jgi:hypothetical protein